MQSAPGPVIDGLELLDIGVGLFDAERRLVHCNPAFRKLRDYPEELCIPGRKLASLLRFSAERGDFGGGKTDALVATRLAEIDALDDREVEREMSDGRILAIRYRHAPSGGLVVTYKDRTAERRAQEALGFSEKRLSLVIDAASDGIFDWDVAADLLYLSERLAALVDVELQDPSTSTTSTLKWLAAIHPDDQTGYVDAIRNHFRGASPAMEQDYRIRAARGGFVWVHERALGHRDENGRVKRYLGAITDITEIRQARVALENSRARLDSALGALSDGILLIDGENRVELFNERYFDIFSKACGGKDMTDEIVVGRDFFEMIRRGYELGMFKAHPGGVNKWMQERRKAYETFANQLEMPLANGMWLLRNERPMPDGGRIAVYTDITEFKRREAEAIEARQRFEEAIESIASGFVLWDADDRLIISNSKYREYFSELADRAVPGVSWTSLMRDAIARGQFPEAFGDEERFIERVKTVRNAANGEVREQLVNGIWLQITDHRTADGGIVSIYTNITELKQRQKDIERQSAILELTMENMEQGITLVDDELNTIAFNQKFLELMGFPPEFFERGFTMEQAFRFNAERGEYGPGDVEEQVRQRLELAAQFLPHRFERIRPNGTVVEIVGNPISGGGIVTTYTDVTERKRAEEELNIALAETKEVLDNIDYGVFLLDRDLRCRLMNKVQQELWGFTDELIADRPTMREMVQYVRDTVDVYDVPEEDWDAWLDQRVERVIKGDIAPAEIHRTDGIILLHRCFSLPDGGRMLTYFDITELKKREMESVQAREKAEAALADLRKAQERLVQAEKMASLGQLTAGIAHEIKNPLNFVNNFAKLSNEMMEELGELIEAPVETLEEEAREEVVDILETVSSNLRKIVEHGRRADSIVKNMLLHSREGPSELQRLALNPIAEEALNLAYHGARAENPNFNIEMVTHVDPEVGEVDCYPQDLMRVFLNLISNGMYAANKRKADAPDGFSPTLTLTTRNRIGVVEVEVRDNGIGIPPEIKEKIFLPFFTTKPAGEGTGLGLSLSYDIVVAQHGGTFAVDSEPNQYSAFTVTIPKVAQRAGKK